LWPLPARRSFDRRGRGATSNTATQMAGNNDPNAPYKLYDGDKLIGTYLTRSEARRKQQQLESEPGSERPEFVIIKDKRGRIVLWTRASAMTIKVTYFPSWGRPPSSLGRVTVARVRLCSWIGGSTRPPRPAGSWERPIGLSLRAEPQRLWHRGRGRASRTLWYA
jgi:hypothetical protein